MSQQRCDPLRPAQYVLRHHNCAGIRVHLWCCHYSPKNGFEGQQPHTCFSVSMNDSSAGVRAVLSLISCTARQSITHLPLLAQSLRCFCTELPASW